MKYRALTVALLLGSGLRAQDSTPVIRVESRTVLVDAVATDKKGHFAQNLSAKDFHVWEDGKEQKITEFSLETSGVSEERPGKHYIVMLFDGLTFEEQLNARRQAMRFVEATASPDRYMAILNFDISGMKVVQNFTTDRDKLIKALGLTSASQVNSGVTSAPQGPAGITRGSRGTVSGAVFMNTAKYREMLEAIDGIANSLAAIRGRKALVFFTGPAPADPDLGSSIARTTAAMNKSNVAVYTVSPKALEADSAGSGDSPENSQSTFGSTRPQTVVSLPSFAENTGGLSLAMDNDLAASLGRVAQEQDWYYLLSYTPSTDSPEGSCHTLRVKASGDIEVRARKAYCTTVPVATSAPKAMAGNLETRAATGVTLDAKLQLPWFYSSPNVGLVNLAMDVPASSIKFRKDKSGFHADIGISGVAYESDDSVAARIGDNIKLDFAGQQQLEAFQKSVWHYENQFRIAPGKYRFVLAFGSESAGFGKAESALQIEPWNGQTLGLSAPALSRDARPADLTASLDPSLLDSAHPLVANATEVIPAGATVFPRGQPVVVYFEAYEPLLTALPASDKAGTLPVIGVRLRVLDRTTGTEKSNTGVKLATGFMRAGNPVVPIVLPVATADLPPGAYVLEIAAVRNSGEPVIRSAGFEVR